MYLFSLKILTFLHSYDNIDVTFYIEMSFIWKRFLILIPEMKKTKNDEEKWGYTWYSADGIYFEGLEITPLEWLENIVELLKQTVQIY